MYNPIDSRLRKINYKPQKLKILTVPTHEGYQTLLGETGHEFYMLQGQGIKQWDFHTRLLPKNHYLITRPFDQVYPPGLQFDLLLSQERYGGLQRFLDMGQKLQVPVLHIDHTMPPPGQNQHTIDELSKMRANAHIFITEFNKQAWSGHPEDIVIPHGIDTATFSGATCLNPAGVSVVNHFQQRDVFCGWTLWQQIAAKVPIKLLGENPGISQSINNPSVLSATLGGFRFFLNTSQWSPVPLSMLEAMAVGIPIVTTAKQEIPKIIQHGHNGFLFDTAEEAVGYCMQLISDKDLALRMGANARKTIEAQFNINKFVSSWNRIITKTYEDYR